MAFLDALVRVIPGLSPLANAFHETLFGPSNRRLTAAEWRELRRLRKLEVLRDRRKALLQPGDDEARRLQQRLAGWEEDEKA